MRYQRIRDLREDQRESQAEVAEKLGLYTTTYQRYERGESEIPFDIAIAIAKHYNASLDYIANLVPAFKPLYTDTSQIQANYNEDIEDLYRAFEKAPDFIKQAIYILLKIKPNSRQ